MFLEIYFCAFYAFIRDDSGQSEMGESEEGDTANGRDQTQTRHVCYASVHGMNDITAGLSVHP